MHNASPVGFCLFPFFSCGVGGGFSLPQHLARGVPLSQNGFVFLISNGVCLLPIIHRFSLTGHPHCLAIILVTQTNVEMMVAFGSTIIVFNEGLFPCQNPVSTTLSFALTRLFGGTAVCGAPRLHWPPSLSRLSFRLLGFLCLAAVNGLHSGSRHL